MQVPIQVSFEGIDHSDALEARIREEVDKLEKFNERITSARVVIARPQHRHQKGDVYQVRIHLTLPGAPDIAISREPAATGAHEDAYVTIRDAFSAARRQLTACCSISILMRTSCASVLTPSFFITCPR